MAGALCRSWGLLTILLATPAAANPCDAAARQAAKATGVPEAVLLAITRVETGRGKTAEPWPWAVNQAGKGSWFASREAAQSYVFSRLRRGERNLDLGCFQINYRWHRTGFPDLASFFDPVKNATYAAEFLKTLHAEYGNWTDAAGAYHSRTPELSAGYKARYRRQLARLGNVGETPARLPSTAPRAPGSLFDLASATQGPLLNRSPSNWRVLP